MIDVFWFISTRVELSLFFHSVIRMDRKSRRKKNDPSPEPQTFSYPSLLFKNQFREKKMKEEFSFTILNHKEKAESKMNETERTELNHLS